MLETIKITLLIGDSSYQREYNLREDFFDRLKSINFKQIDSNLKIFYTSSYYKEFAFEFKDLEGFEFRVECAFSPNLDVRIESTFDYSIPNILCCSIVDVIYKMIKDIKAKYKENLNKKIRKHLDLAVYGLPWNTDMSKYKNTMDIGKGIILTAPLDDFGRVIYTDTDGYIKEKSKNTNKVFVNWGIKTKELKSIGENMIQKIQINKEKKIVTVVFEDDDVKMIKCSEKDEFDPIIGTALCISAHLFKSKTKFKKFVNEQIEKNNYKAKKKEAKKWIKSHPLVSGKPTQETANEERVMTEEQGKSIRYYSSILRKYFKSYQDLLKAEVEYQNESYK